MTVIKRRRDTRSSAGPRPRRVAQRASKSGTVSIGAASPLTSAEGFGEGSGRNGRRLKKADSPVYALSAPAAFDAECAWTADRILEHHELQDFANRQVTKPYPLPQVAPVEEHAAAIGKADEAVSLPEHQLHDGARARRALRSRGQLRLRLAGRRRLSGDALGVLRHFLPARF